MYVTGEESNPFSLKTMGNPNVCSLENLSLSVDLIPAEGGRVASLRSRLNFSRNDRIGECGSIVSWPVTSSGIHLDVTDGPEAGTAEMFYSERLQEGSCGIWRHTTDQVLEMKFEASRLPFLGLWIAYGGWPEASDRPRQYAIALEPTTSACNSLAEAQRTSCAVEIEDGGAFEWEIWFRIITQARDSKLFA